jgi:phosphate transport system substrate-binding protein
VIGKKCLSVIGAGALALGLVACSDDSDENGPSGDNGGNGISGNIELDGSSTVAPLSEAAAELFMIEYPEVLVSVGTSGTGGGFQQFCIGETDGSNASREISDEEAEECADNGIAYEAVQVANDAMTLMINQDNPVDCLTVDQLSQIWEPGSELTNWNEIDGLDVDFDADLDLYGPGPDSGTFDYFTSAINGEAGAERTEFINIG